MEIPGLSRLKSPDKTIDVVPTPQSDPLTTNPQAQPINIDPALEKRIALMKEQIRLKKKIEAEQKAKKDTLADAAKHPDEQESAPIRIDKLPITSPPSAIVRPGGVNFSILDQVLANHGFEEAEDSDEEMIDEQDQVTSEQDLSSGSSSVSVDSDDESDIAPITEQDRKKMLDMDEDGADANEIPRTKHELLEDEEPVKRPDFVIPADEPIEQLGTITNIVNKTCVITGAPSPTTRVLDVGSLLVFSDRSNLGFVADTFGPVILPMFSVRFSTAEEVEDAGVQLGKIVYLVPKHANYVFSDTLKIKGTDASNMHDEEQSEVEFSDDEQEALYKAERKQQRRQERQGDRPMPRDSRPLNDLEAVAQAQGLSYDSTMQSTSSVRADGTTYNSQRGGRGGRGGRGRGQQRPRQQVASASTPESANQHSSSTTIFQRPYYQAPTTAPGTSVPTQAPPSGTSTLYKPLQRPS